MGLLDLARHVVSEEGAETLVQAAAFSAPPKRTYPGPNLGLSDDMKALIEELFKFLGCPLEDDDRRLPDNPLDLPPPRMKISTEAGLFAILELDPSDAKRGEVNGLYMLLNHLWILEFKRVYFFTFSEVISEKFDEWVWKAFRRTPGANGSPGDHERRFDRIEVFTGKDLQRFEGEELPNKARFLKSELGIPVNVQGGHGASGHGSMYSEALLQEIADHLVGLGVVLLDTLLRQALNISYERAAPAADSFELRVLAMVHYWDRTRSIPLFVKRCRLIRRDDAKFQDLAKKLRLDAGGVKTKDIEATLADKNRLMPIAEKQVQLQRVATRMAMARSQVCRVLIAKEPRGTGFLVGPKHVLTNYHVLKPVFQDNTLRRKLSFQFDYALDESGTELDVRDPVPVAEVWELCASGCPGMEGQGFDINLSVGEDQLDFVLIELAEEVGRMPVVKAKEVNEEPEVERVTEAVEQPDAPMRGWLSLAPGDWPRPEPHDMVYVIQYPAGEDLRTSERRDGIVGYEFEDRRLLYSTETLPGSSGSPVFDAEMNLIAMHHLGDPSTELFHQDGYGAGIPIDKIVALVKKKTNGKIDLADMGA